ncbi:hypothetical protein SAMN06265171_105277 [Chryseobacterium rhizoplanae]|uniref:Uncharacterized protein n=1 Tax=Chryseobacterium rhizoplanae TaxID=1609531 RepID=A0A521DMF0_9FLAO|nr:hypothetical protein [Chryseobacterium rhizoplanae]SMO72775.1 hypothetical protein SAMN06265171_105277 [Chryseobacterium rhizoplanae]
MKKNLLAIICFVSGFVYSQQNGSVGISKGSSFRPDIKAIVDVDSKDAGALFPRLTTLERDAIAVSVQEDGLLIYNTDEKCFDYYQALSGTWKQMCGNVDSSVPKPHLKLLQQSKNSKKKK